MKLIRYVLCLSLLALLVSPNIQEVSASDNVVNDTKSYELGTKSSESIKSIPLEEIKSHIDQSGNTIIFEGNDIDKLSLYENIFKTLNIPLFLENGEFSKVHPDAKLIENESIVEGEKNTVVQTKTTLIALYNIDGKIFVLQNDEPTNENISKIKSYKSYVEMDDHKSFVDDFKADMDKLYSSSPTSKLATAAVQQGNILTSIRKTLSVNGKYTVIGGSKVDYIAGKAVTDYILYSNTTGSHFYVLADSQIYPAGVVSPSNVVWTTGYKSNIRKNSTTNNLISWSPNTNGLPLENNTEYNVGATVSNTGLDLSFSYTWQGAPAVTMQSVGDKQTGLATEYVYKTNGKGLSGKSFTIGHGALIQATNKVLSFSASHQFRSEDFYASGVNWYSTNATNLSYSF